MSGIAEVEGVFDMYEKVLMNGFSLDHSTPFYTSMSQLQEWRPDLTDEVLAESGFVRGVHIVCVHDGKITPMVPPE